MKTSEAVKESFRVKVLDYFFALSIIGSFIQFAILIAARTYSKTEIAISSATLLLVCLAGYGLFNRTRWGCVLALVVCGFRIIESIPGIVFGLTMTTLIIWEWKSFGSKRNRAHPQNA